MEQIDEIRDLFENDIKQYIETLKGITISTTLASKSLLNIIKKLGLNNKEKYKIRKIYAKHIIRKP